MRTLKPGAINLDLLPPQWGLVACGRRKQPYQKRWQQHLLTKAQISAEISQGRCHAVGVLCGVPSGGLLFVDHDGASCDALIEQLSGVSLSEALPQTLTISSGKQGRFQSVYRVPEMFWSGISTHRIATGTTGEQLEFRWTGCQSIAMGAHPETDGYRWTGTPDDIVAAPLWMIEQMLDGTAPAAEASPLTPAPMTDIDWALSYLAAIPATEDYEQWLYVGMALHSVSESLLSEWDAWSRPASNYNEKDCATKWKSFKRSGKGIGYLGWLAKSHGWISPVSTQSAPSQQAADKLKAKQGKNSGSPVSKSADFEKNNSESLITDQEWIRFAKSMQSPGSFDPFHWLPERLAQLARTDAARSAIDPMALWAYLLPATLSLMGQDCWVNMNGEGGWREPNVIWSLLVGKSGSGKSRALDLVLGPLEKWNLTEFENWKMRVEDWQQQEKARAKDKSDDDTSSPKPKCRRYLIGQATPEGIVRRLADQEDNGVLACRDEFAGFIKGLTQYTNGKGDGMEMLLETWGGKGLIVDRADEDKSFSVAATRLSLVGGIQPGIFSKTFETAEDAQGSLGRFLVVEPADIPYRVYDGPVLLPGELSKIYRFIDTSLWGDIEPTREAREIIYEFTTEFKNTVPPTPNAHAWQQKLHANTIRMAMAIHALECFYDKAKDRQTLTADTVRRAHHMARHYQDHFFRLMGYAADDGVPAILRKIQEQAHAFSDGIAPRDVVRGSSARLVERHARIEGMRPTDYVRHVFDLLQERGWGRVEVSQSGNGRLRVAYKANENFPKSADLLTRIDETHEHQGLRTVETADWGADSAADSDCDYSLKDTRNKGFQDSNGDIESADWDSGVATSSEQHGLTDTIHSSVSVEELSPPIPVGAVVILSYPRRGNPASFQGYGCQGVISAVHRTRDNWSCSVDVDGETITAWIGDLEELIDG